MLLSIDNILKATQGRLVQGKASAEATGISTDTRTLLPGEFYVALLGPSFDGHDFISAAREKGAAGVLVSRDIKAPDHLCMIRCDDSLQALGALAQFWRKKFSLPVVAITGSCGKTTTKDILQACLSEAGSVCATEGNLNNLIGVPRTLFRLTAKHDFAIIEMGMNAPGEIRRLAEMTEPTLGLITNVGLAHLEGLGTIEGVARAKAELFESLGPTALALVNADDERIKKMNTAARRLRYGMEGPADFRVVDWAETATGARLLIAHGGQRLEFSVPLHGKFNVHNALAAISVCLALGVEVKLIQAGLNKIKLTKLRGEEKIWGDNILLINDAYNANPSSMREMLVSVAQRFPQRRKIAVLGEMWELGDASVSLHEELGGTVAQLGFTALYGFGERAEATVRGFEKAGGPWAQIYRSHEELAQDLARSTKSHDVVLIKGSRATQMEKVLSLLVTPEKN